MKDLTSGDVATRLAALERSASQVPYKNWLHDASVRNPTVSYYLPFTLEDVDVLSNFILLVYY